MKRFLFALIALLVPGIASAQIVNWGDYVDTDQTIYMYFNTVGTDGVAEDWDISGLTTTTAAVIYEDGSSTEITSAETVDDDFDGRTGFHQVAVALSDAGFETGKTYTVVLLTGSTVDSVSVANRIVGVFSVGRYSSSTDITTIVDTRADTTDGLIATAQVDIDAILDDTGTSGVFVPGVTSGTSDSGTTTTMVDAARTEANTDYWKGNAIVFTSGTLNGQTRLITGFNTTTDTITFSPATTVAAGTHTYQIVPWANVSVTVGGIVADSIETNAITASKIQDGTITANEFASGAITASVIATDAIDADAFAGDAGTELGTAVWATTTRQLTGTQTFNVTGNITGNLSGSVGSVTGAVGSVTGAVGSVAADGITASSIATNAIGALELADAALTEATFDAGVLFDPETDDVIVASLAANSLTAAAAAADLGTELGTATWATTTRQLTGTQTFNNTGTWTGNITGSLSGSVGSVTGAVGSVTGSAGTWNAAWDTEVESEANDALVAQRLDHLVAVADADDVVDNSILAKLSSKSATADWSTYNNTTDSLEANRDNIGTAGAGLTAVVGTTETRDLRPVAATNTLQMVQRASGVVSLNRLTIYQGETKRCAFDCTAILPAGEVLADMAAPTASVANLTPTEVGIDAKQAKFTLACGASVTAGTYNVRTTISTDPDSGPILIIGTVVVLDD